MQLEGLVEAEIEELVGDGREEGNGVVLMGIEEMKMGRRKYWPHSLVYAEKNCMRMRMKKRTKGRCPPIRCLC